MVCWEGWGNEPAQANARLGEVITGKEQNHRFRWQTYRNVRVGGGGDSGVTEMPSGTGRGCLGSGGEPTGLLRWRYWYRMGSRDRWVGGELNSVFLRKPPQKTGIFFNARFMDARHDEGL